MIQKSLLFPAKLLLKIVVSPLLLFAIGYLYYGDAGKAYYLALIGYTIITVFSLILTGFSILPTMARFNLLKLIRKSYKIASMLVALGIYWVIYLLFWA